jgi:hypothetical protein
MLVQGNPSFALSPLSSPSPDGAGENGGADYLQVGMQKTRQRSSSTPTPQEDVRPGLVDFFFPGGT